MEQAPKRTTQPEWAAQIQKAAAEALTAAEIDQIHREYDEMSRAYLAGEISQPEYDAHNKVLEETPGVVTADSLPEFRALLVATGIPQWEINEILSHENAHMTEAIKLQVAPVYRVQFIKEENGTVTLIPSIHFAFPDDISDEERREKLKIITEAPDNLSDSDKHRLGHGSSGK